MIRARYLEAFLQGYNLRVLAINYGIFKFFYCGLRYDNCRAGCAWGGGITRPGSVGDSSRVVEYYTIQAGVRGNPFIEFVINTQSRIDFFLSVSEGLRVRVGAASHLVKPVAADLLAGSPSLPITQFV